jgi:FtsP/CotA-like multicopper oxidase with cupredoxin domain
MRTNRVIPFLLTLLLIAAVPASAQWIPCLGDPVAPATTWTAPDLPTVPELISNGGKLRATVVLTDEQQRLTFKTPPGKAPSDTNVIKCAPQYVRVFKGIGAMPPIPKPTSDYPDPMPGPTLRARLGDMIELTFLNQINPADFGDSIDRGDVDTGSGCDETSTGYPKVTTTPPQDTYPDCFHGSSTANIHFHGTHTNPNSTGDNVFIEIRPSMRANGKPIVTAASVATPFSDFFQRCEAKLGGNVLSLWPHTWSDLPSAYTTRQKELLQKYDMTPNIKKLWPVDAAQIKKGDWPQYYMGAYPYCYQIPKYTDTVFPPPGNTAEHTGHTGGPLSPPPQKPLQMGQSPGIHWYHAHKHGSTAIDVGNGMTGAFVIEGQYDDDFDTYYGVGWMRKQPVLVINQIGVTPNLERGATARTDKGPDFSVNGRTRPVMKMQPGEVKLWRIVNTSGRAGTLFVGMYNAAGQPAVDGSGKPLFTWYQTAQDGVQFSPSNYGNPRFTNNQFLLAAGNRADLLVQAPLTAGVYSVRVMNEVDPRDLPTANAVTLFSVNVTGPNATGKTATLMPTAPSFPPFLHDIQTAEVKGTKEITFSSLGPAGGGGHLINHKKFDGEVGALVLLNTVEEWKITNETYSAISHPFHIHINPFQVTEIFDPNAILSTSAGAGTVTATGTKTITGTGTSFSSLRPGTVLTMPGSGPYTVLSVLSDTSLTLTGNGPTLTNSAYSINVPQYVFVNSPATPPLPGQCYLNPSDSSTWKPCASVPQPPAPQALSSEKNIWWDVFPIPSGIKVSWVGTAVPVPVPGYFKLRSRFVDYSGYYVIHCHILAHEDRGMMTVVEVAPAASPYSHD